MQLIRRNPRPPRHPKPHMMARLSEPHMMARIAILCASAFVLGMAAPQGIPQQALATPSTTALAAAQTQCPKPDPNLWPFGVVCGRDYDVPSPPESPSLVPTITTKTTTRIWGTDPFQEAVSVTQHVFPAALPENAPGETNNVPDRPCGVTLIPPY